MARVIENYSAVMNSTDYIFDRPDVSGSKTQYDYGQELRLPANYGERETDGFYPVTYPENGWIRYYVVGGITPNYKTVTDKCTPPSSLTISGNKMIIIGGAGGDLNTFAGYGISWRERDITGDEWSAWSAETETTTTTVNVTANAGKVRQYRARTQGSAGEAYYSDYVVCETLVSGNTAAKVPTILLPVSGAVSSSQTPVVVVNCGADNEGDQMTLQRSIDGGDWINAATVPGDGGTVYDRLPAQTAGTHVIGYKLTDINAAESETVSVSVVIGAASWTREIKSGDIISNKNISHIADINEMAAAVNVQRLYYGLEPISLPGTVGKFADWGQQMQTMLDASKQCLAAAGQPVTASTSDVYPSANTINELRQRITMV